MTIWLTQFVWPQVQSKLKLSLDFELLCDFGTLKIIDDIAYDWFIQLQKVLQPCG